MIARIIALLAASMLATQAIASSPCGPRRLALTFDDAPRSDTQVMSGWERAARILAALDSAGVDEVAFFSLSKPAEGEGLERLQTYAAAGHILGNHSASHPNLHEVGAEAFMQDVRTAHAKLSQLQGFRPWFRFPMLNEGKSTEERDRVRRELAELGYSQGYVTIDTFDFYIDNFLKHAAAAGRELDKPALGRLYVELIRDAAEHYDSVACRWLGRSPAHVLLLHENDVAALYLDDLIAALRAEGWAIISPTEAYSDPIAQTIPNTLLLGQGRVAALAHIAGAAPESLRHASENIAYLDQRLQAVVRPSPPAP